MQMEPANPLRRLRWKRARSPLAIAPLVVLMACGGGGGGEDRSSGGSGDTTAQTAAPLTAADSDVPLVGNLIADCGETGVALADTLIDDVNSIAALPVA